MVLIFRDHDDARLATAAEDIREHHALYGVAKNVEVALPADVGNAVVEMESDVAAIAAQRDHAVTLVGIVAGNGLGAFGCHPGCIVARLPDRQVVNKLSRSGHILIYGQKILTVNSVVGHLLGLKRQDSRECYKARQCRNSWSFHVVFF